MGAPPPGEVHRGALENLVLHLQHSGTTTQLDELPSSVAPIPTGIDIVLAKHRRRHDSLRLYVVRVDGSGEV